MYGRVPVSVVTHVVVPPYLLRPPVIANVRVQADEDAVLVQVAGRLSRGPAREVRFFVRFRPDKSPWILLFFEYVNILKDTESHHLY